MKNTAKHTEDKIIKDLAAERLLRQKSKEKFDKWCSDLDNKAEKFATTMKSHRAKA